MTNFNPSTKDPSGHPMELKDRLDRILKESNLNVRELSWELRVPEQSLRTWLLGRIPYPKSSLWASLAQAEKERGLS
jgi:hypothetical protein